jgi:hypothetical protein
VTGNVLCQEIPYDRNKDSVIILILPVVLMQKVGRKRILFIQMEKRCCEFFLVF